MTTIRQYQLGCQIIYTKDEWLILQKEITCFCWGIWKPKILSLDFWAPCKEKMEHKIISYHSYLIKTERSDM